MLVGIDRPQDNLRPLDVLFFVRTSELLQMQARIRPPSWGAAACGGGVFGCVFIVFSL